MPQVNAQEVISGLALVIMGILSGVLIFNAVPQANTELVTFTLGAISGALAVPSAQKAADKLTQRTSLTSNAPGQASTSTSSETTTLPQP